MRVVVETELSLREVSVERGLITWFFASVVEGPGALRPIARARVARVQVELAVQLGIAPRQALAAGQLSELAVFFEEDWFSRQFEEGPGRDLLYFSEVTVDVEWQGRGVELALARRLCDSLGQGCELAVVRAESEAEALHWGRLGFRPALAMGASRLQQLALSSRTVEVVSTGEGGFRAVASAQS